MAVKMIVQSKPEPKSPVAVKGTREGLVFLLDEHCAYADLYRCLTDLFTGESAGLFNGPQVAVSVDYGDRVLTPEQARELLGVFLARENFFVREWGGHTAARRALYGQRPSARTRNQFIHKGTVRAGQDLYFDGDVVVVGDVNPGGQVSAAGDIYVFGRLRGVAHAGIHGDERAIIAAAEFAPTQVRIASVVGWEPESAGEVMSTFMEFAYLTADGMAVDKMQYAAVLRPVDPGTEDGPGGAGASAGEGG
ncbi:septum site-determining protein MinC [Alicyclobacillus macrosporangiidus]|uniref:septum site-determining protein MinC n=1 Tax=Alicyclobacillus macrosporangiidus TaxID=392015 RepID=UPI000A9D864E|nr:septum site-determining protein MinC [Alicyclobacillus macrosporangiidus]